MKRLLLGLVLVLSLSAPVFAQDADKIKRSQETQLKIRQLFMMVQLLPLTLKKAQYGDLLTAIEKARAAEKEIVLSEDDEILKLEKKISDATSAAIDKGAYPPRDLLSESDKLINALNIRRQIVANSMIDLVYQAVDKTFNPGQKKVAANSLDWRHIDPTANVDDTKDESKIRFYIKRILLDPITYDLLVQMSKNALD